MTPKMMVLGVACEEPGTVGEIQSRLTDLFVSADFPKNAAHTSLPVLAKEGYLRLVDDGTDSRYEGTPAGVRHLREWVSNRPPIPALRESVQARVEFATLDELADVIIAAWAEAKASQLISDDAHSRMLLVRRRRLRSRPKSRAEALDAELSAAHLADVKLMWEDVANRRRKLASRLELIHNRFVGDSE